MYTSEERVGGWRENCFTLQCCSSHFWDLRRVFSLEKHHIDTRTFSCNSEFHSVGAVRITSWYPKINGSHFGLPTQSYPQNDWTGWQNGVNYDICAQAPSAIFRHVPVWSYNRWLRQTQSYRKSVFVFVWCCLACSVKLFASSTLFWNGWWYVLMDAFFFVF